MRISFYKKISLKELDKELLEGAKICVRYFNLHYPANKVTSNNESLKNNCCYIS